MRYRHFLTLTALLCCLGLIAPPPAEAAQRPLRVVYGFDREFTPFSYEDPGGKAVGFEVELLEAALQGRATLVTRPTDWKLIPTELAGGNITITSGMVKTEERGKFFTFSALPTVEVPISFFTKNTRRYPNASFMRGQRVAVEQGSYAHRLLQQFGGTNIKTFPDKASGVRALYNDEVEAYLGPAQSTYYLLSKFRFEGISTLGTPLGISHMRFAVNRERGDISRMLDSALKELVANGEYDRIYRKWFVKELTETELTNLIKEAKEAATYAYTPHSLKTRGAAILGATGVVYRGCAVENRKADLSVPAVTAALTAAIGAGELEIRAAVLVNADGNPLPMSEAELQQLTEFGRGVLSISRNADGEQRIEMVGSLLAKSPSTAKKQ